MRSASTSVRDRVQRRRLTGLPSSSRSRPGTSSRYSASSWSRRPWGRSHMPGAPRSTASRIAPTRDIAVGRLETRGGHARARDRAMADNARIKIAVHGQREGPRDGRRRHDQQVRPRAPWSARRCAARRRIDAARRSPRGLKARNDTSSPKDRHACRRARRDRPSAGPSRHARALRLRGSRPSAAPTRRRGLQQGPALDCVLLREDARGRHDARLHAGIGRGCEGNACDRGLTRAHVAEQQAIHDAVAAVISARISRTAGSCSVAEREGKRLRAQGRRAGPARAARARRRGGWRRCAGEGRAAGKHLVIREALARELDLAPCGGGVQGAEGAREAHELAALTAAARERGRRRVPVLERDRRRCGASTPGSRHRGPGARARSFRAPLRMSFSKWGDAICLNPSRELDLAHNGRADRHASAAGLSTAA